MKNKSFINNISKKILALFLALLTMVSLIVPAFSAGVNVDGQGGTNVSLGSVSGKSYYNNADSMWKISIYYSRYDTNTEKTKNLATQSHWVQYGKTFYMYNPTANRGASGKINMNFIKNSVFYTGNKVNFLKTTTDVTKISNINLSLYSKNYFYPNDKSPAIAMNGYTNDAVKEFFGTNSNFVALAQQAYKAAGYDNWIDCFVYPDGPNKGKKVTFSIDGFSGSSVDKTANNGKSATTGYTWDTTQKHLVFNDWYRAIKKDYNGKQIYLHPKFSGNTSLFGTAWVIVYEPVLCIEPKTALSINGVAYKYFCCTPTEYAILQYYKAIDVGVLANTVFGHLSNSTVLDKTWFGYSVPSGKFSATSSTMTTDLLNKIYKQAGWGMTIFDPYNYVIKDYEMKISVPKTAKTGEAFSVKYYATNKSKDNNRNTGNTNNPITVNFVWVARVYNGTNEYWFDLWNLRNKTLTTSNALKNGSTLVTTYSEAAKIVEARRSSDDGKPKSKIPAKTQNKWEDYTYTLDSAFSGYTFEVRACVNTDTDGSNSFAKKELNSGAYYKSGEIKK